MYSLVSGADDLGFPSGTPLPSFNADSVRKVLEGQHPELRVRYVPRIDSTMNVAKWARENGEECSPGLLLIAGEQPAGIGYKGVWRSVPHQDIMMTLVVTDVATVKEMRLKQFCSALAVCQALEQTLRYLGKFSCPFGNRPFVIKYPNDVYANVGSEYRKISGSMCIGSADNFWKAARSANTGIEFPSDVALLGIGINLATQTAPPDYDGPPRVSFQELAGELVTRETVIVRVVDSVCKSLARLHRNPDEFCRSLVPHFSVVSGGRARLDYLGEVSPKSEQLVFQEITSEGAVFLRNGAPMLIPHGRMERIVDV